MAAGDERRQLLEALTALEAKAPSEAPPVPPDDRAFSVDVWLGFFAEHDKRWVGAVGPFEEDHATEVARQLRGLPLDGNEEVGTPILYAVVCAAKFRIDEDDGEDEDKS